jgi:AraC-like DNA-binding protein
MQELSTHIRIKALYRMLFEMATGNLYFRLTPATSNDAIGQLQHRLTVLALDLHQCCLSLEVAAPYYSYQNLIQFSIAFTFDGNIKSFSASASRMLEYTPEELITLNLSDIMPRESLLQIRQIKTAIRNDPAYHTTVKLLVITKNHQILPASFTISRHHYSNSIFFSYITTVFQEHLPESVPMKPSAVRKAELFHRVAQHIKDHLEEPLPSARELAQQFGSNEFQLKSSFKQHLNTSVYQFYTDERLKKAHELIQETAISLKAIALCSGFNDYPTFYKAFKKRYGYTPIEVKRFLLEDGEENH